MKSLSIAGLVAGLSVTASVAHAQPAQLQGSDTLFGAVTQAITAAQLDSVLHYIGGGSGTGENGLIAGTQGIAPMSRTLSTAAINALNDQGVTPVIHVIGLDGVSLFVQADPAAPHGTCIDIPTLRAIYLCQITDWEDVPMCGTSGPRRPGPIHPLARNGLSGTTDTFKTLISYPIATTNGNANWPSCVTEVQTTDDIASGTSTDASAIGFAGLSGGRPTNTALQISATATSTPIAPTQTTIRNFSYPLARRLYVNAVDGGRIPSDDEQALLDAMLTRSFMDPILTANEFITCPARCP